MSEERTRMVISDHLVNIEYYKRLWNDISPGLIDECNSAKANTAKSMTKTVSKEMPDTDKSHIELCAQNLFDKMMNEPIDSDAMYTELKNRGLCND